jgi:hypothetical protein
MKGNSRWLVKCRASREIFAPLQSPRYLLVTKDEEFAVPHVFAERKERAKERFEESMHHLRTKSRLRWE